MRKDKIVKALKTVGAIPFVAVGVVLLFAAIVLRAAGYIFLFDTEAAKYEINQIKPNK